MDPVTAHVLIDRPREEVFEYLADIANHPEFSDHYLKEWRLTRVESFGRGAGARFKIDAPLDRFGWGDMTFIEVERPHRIVAAGRAGKFNRNKTWTTWTLVARGQRDPRRGHDRVRARAADRQVHGGRHRAAAAGRSAAWARRCGACSRSSKRASTAGERATVGGL